MLHDFVAPGTNFCWNLCFKIEHTGNYEGKVEQKLQNVALGTNQGNGI